MAITNWLDWIVRTVTEAFSGYFMNPTETEEDSESVTEYISQIVYDPPLRDHKYILVEEMPDFFTDEELNTVYHSKEEYETANQKYGIIFKHQKFENADTAEKLLEYATDWMKNNYHGGITSFDITALDLHLTGEQVDPYMVGDRADVNYPDPDAGHEVLQTLTVISAEYPLHNPDKNRYKIGIPDVTLNKVYGESSKSGGGGGGGTKDESETDTEDEQETESLLDRVSKIMEIMSENHWSFCDKELRDQVITLLTPAERDEDNPWYMNLVCDFFKTGDLKSTIGEFTENLKAKFLNVVNDLNVGADLKVEGDAEANSLESKTDVVVGSETLTSQDVTKIHNIDNYVRNLVQQYLQQ